MRVVSKSRVASPLIAIVLLIFASAACSGNDTEPPTEIPQSTAVPTSTPIPRPPPTSTTSPTPTPDPTATDVASPSSEPPASPGSVQLPHDEGVHLSGLEWFYFNGHLTAENGQEFSYHFVTFQTVQPSGLTSRLAQVSWADHAETLHLTGERAAAPRPEASSGEFDLPTADWRMSGDGEEYQLSFEVGEYVVELEAISQKPAVLHHGSGLVDLGIAGKTYYYSRTRLETSGTVTVGGVSHAVTGVSWMDHQWGEFTILGIGWDWLSLNLDDGSDLTVSVVWEQEEHKHISTYGTYVPADSSAVHLPGDDVSLEPGGTWTSPETGAVYPVDWRLRVDSLELDLSLTASIEEAEFALSSFIPVVYWEGSVAAAGTKGGTPVAGRGFVEMVGYAPFALEIPATEPAQR